MDKSTDTILISATQREEIQATHADLYISVKGSSLVSGDAALKKAKEVSQLVDELIQAGLPAEAVHLQSVYAETSSGAMLRSSSATYWLRLRCEKLELFAELLGVVNSQKNSTFERVDWKYPEETVHEAALEKALQKANDKAQKVAASLGVKLLGIASFKESMNDQEAIVPQSKFAAQAAAPRAMGIISQPDLGIDIQHSKTVEVRVDIGFHISRFNNKEEETPTEE